MNHCDETLAFGCGDAQLVGIVSVPDLPGDTAVVVIVGGPQYRAGSHRQFVLLARALAGAGYPVVRFDVRGMGDSTGEPRDFEAVSPDIGAAIDALQQRLSQVTRIVLWGLCDGASAALLYCDEMQDPRVCGLCLANPWVRSETGLAATQVRHYYTRRLVQPEFWAKLASGKVGWNAPAEFGHKLRLAFKAGAAAADAGASAPHPLYQQRMAAAWIGFDGAILLMLSGQDLTAREFVEHSKREPAWAAALRHPRLTRLEFAAADHTFSDPQSRREVQTATLDWVAQEVVGRAPRRAAQPVATTYGGRR